VERWVENDWGQLEQSSGSGKERVGHKGLGEADLLTAGSSGQGREGGEERSGMNTVALSNMAVMR
jgi:hypothetical protein